MEEIRLQKYLASQGIASRRKCEEYILDGLVEVNGKKVLELGTKIDPQKDKVSFNGKILENVGDERVYVLLNKPIGYVTTVKDQFKRDTVLDLVKTDKRLVPVRKARYVYFAEHLFLQMTGDFVYKVTHPKHEITKTYTVTLIGEITKEEIERLEKGVDIEDYITKPALVKILKIDKEKGISRLEITIHEGKNRQIRKMCESIRKEGKGSS